MKKLTFLIAILVAFNLNSQKKELRQVDKLISQSFFDEANSNNRNTTFFIITAIQKSKYTKFRLKRICIKMEKL